MGFFVPIGGEAPQASGAAPLPDASPPPTTGSFFAPLPPAAPAVPSAGKLARAAWNQGGQTLQIQPGAILGIPGTLNTHIPLPRGFEHKLIFQGRALHDVGQGIENAGRWIGDKLTGKPYTAPPRTAADRIMAAAERQHPVFNYGVKWPTELAASLPLGEAAGMGTGALMDAAGASAGEGAPLLQRALYALPRSAAMGAAYGIQQPQGDPAINASIGAAAAPLMEMGANAVGKTVGFGNDVLDTLRARVSPRALGQPELDARVGDLLRANGAPAVVQPRALPDGVQLTTAAHADDPYLLDLQGKERAGTRAVPFQELADQNNKAIVNGLRQHLAQQPDSGALSDMAHQMLLEGQARGKAAVSAAYAPFDAVKGGVYLDRGPVQDSLRETYSKLLPSHQEMLPPKVREVMEADHPLHLMTDVEDLGARLSDAIGNAAPGTPASRALMQMRDALNRGVENAPLANQPELGALTYDAARNPLPGRNVAASDPTQDSILQWLAKHPKGLSSEEGAAQGLDPADMRGSAARVGIKRAFRSGGMSFDQAAEALHQAGYPVADARGNYDPNVLLNALDSELRGKPVYSMTNSRLAAEFAHEAAPSASRAAPDLTELTKRAMQANPERAQAALESWTDDEPATLVRVQAELHAAANPGTEHAADATDLWKQAKDANRQFRERFPQGTARDTEAQTWLAKRLTGKMEPTKFLSEALTTRGRSEALLNAFDNPEEREQMRGMLRNQYVNRLLAPSVEGERTLNPTNITRLRTTLRPVEQSILTGPERDTLDQYVEAARGNARILERSLRGSSETASLLKHAENKAHSFGADVLAHAASSVHPMAGLLMKALPLIAQNPGNDAALQNTLTAALLDPDVYNRVIQAVPAAPSGFAEFLRRIGPNVGKSAVRGASFVVPRGLGPLATGKVR